MKNFSINMKIQWIILIASLLTVGCESPGFVEGKVIDAETQLPLEGVKCVVTTGKQIEYTDSVGAFSVSNSTSPCAIWGKKEITVEFSREDYATQTTSRQGSNVTILLQKQ
jgi:hypothetical protein